VPCYLYVYRSQTVRLSEQIIAGAKQLTSNNSANIKHT